MCPTTRVAFNGDRGRAAAQRLPAALQPVACSRRPQRFQRAGRGPPMVWSRAGWTGSQRYPIQLGRRSAERLGRARGIDPRRPVVGHERRCRITAPTSAASTAPQQPSAELYRALAAGGGVRLAHPRCTASASASRGRSAPRPRRSRASGSRSATGCIPYLAARDRTGDATGTAGDARDAARVSRQRAHARLRDAVHVRRRAARRADRRAGRRGRDRAAARRRGTTSTRGSASPGGRCCATSATLDQFPGVRARRLRAAARPGGPAHGRDRPRRTPLEQLWVFGKPRALA